MGVPLINDEFTEVQNVVDHILWSYPHIKREALVRLVTTNYRKNNSVSKATNTKTKKKKQ
jgi:glycosylphosphatidylinositol transamidase (GPIT) subunit GPI8